ncbi:Rieske (2Fe-2S) protein [Alteribacter natronophilus]|uniref:Rieske (2Fe-2S) protein n=1 Tax=Alteribacter natronophilus TaxID=2583810 RepID=UPI00110E2C4E|nr:Rieske 2Fe-2S domain-containing protein [Alteribacter natronophilus]TMW73422.1 Rieske 2Fe-2S domain-containing protein [Alteribacter natronophilus]
MNEVYAGTLEELKEKHTKVVKGGRHGIAVIFHEDEVYAVDNRCPHLGFPLHMGSVCDGLLTCHWHHARFDLNSGGTLDPWADDVPVYPVKINDGEIRIILSPKTPPSVEKHKNRLKEGLEQNLSLVIAKSVTGLVQAGVPLADIAGIGVNFGVRHRWNGWRSGLTILTAMTNMLPFLDRNGQILALYQGLVHVARESEGMGTRFLAGPLPLSDQDEAPSFERMAGWYRHSVEVRDVQGAERILLTAAQSDAENSQLAGMMMSAITDHYYMNTGHTLDFHNKAFEILEKIGSENRGLILTSLLPELSGAQRSEELHSWQAPVNLTELLESAFTDLETIEFGTREAEDPDHILETILKDDPAQTVNILTEKLRGGTSPVSLARVVTAAAGERIARFHVQNEFRDWITVLHTFSHSHAVHMSLKRSLSRPLVRGIFHSAMSIYLDRFLNTPAARIPEAGLENASNPDDLLDLLDRQQQTGEAARWLAAYLKQGGDRRALFNTLGHAVLREDAEFHTFQVLEAAVAEHEEWNGFSGDFSERAKDTMLFAAVRYIAAHAPTSREIPHTAKIAMRLSKGENLFEEE